MRVISLERYYLSQTAIVSLVTVVAIALLSVVMARWTWAGFAPHPEAGVLQRAQAFVHVEAAYGLFGAVPKNHESMVPTGIAIRLLGIVTATTGHPGYALVKLEEKEIRAVKEGEEISSNIRLAEVGMDHLILERNGIRETLALPRKNISVESENDIFIAGK